MSIPYAAFGGSTFLAYQLIKDAINYYGSNVDKPAFIDHHIAFTSVFCLAVIYHWSPLHIITAFIGANLLCKFIFNNSAPMLWSVKVYALDSPFDRHSNIFYEDSCTQEEVDKYRY